MGRSLNRKMEFKRFTVLDDKCAMKIGTDAVLLGAIATHPNPKHILDIGAGSGIVALMLAQRFPNSSVTAVELENGAALQASDNFTNSPFFERLNCINDSFQNISSTKTLGKFDLIVSNPPFFDGTSKSPYEPRNMARHEDYLKIDELFSGIENVIEDEGVFIVVWPVEREEVLTQSAAKHYYYQVYRSEIRATSNHEAVRIISGFSKVRPPEIIEGEIILESGVGENRVFTPEYLKLVKDFFLKA